MIPVNQPTPPTQSNAPGWQWSYAGCNGPDISRAAYAMANGPDIQGYFTGPYYPPSSVMLHGQDSGKW